MNLRRLAMATGVGMGAIATLLWLLGSTGTPVTAGPALSVSGMPEASAVEKPAESPLSDATPLHYVAITGTDSSDCSMPISACLTIQYAVDQAGEGDEIRVASGSYTGVNVRPRNDITTTGVVTQVVYISKTVAIRGGYTTTNNFADPPDPVANPTTLDAQEQGRVLYVTGDISPTVEGLRITGGDAAGLGGSSGDYDAGGGLYVAHATPMISSNLVFSNTALHGGGLYLWRSDATLKGNDVISNTCSHSGGGLFLCYGAAKLSGNTITHNTASSGGGGLSLYHSTPTLSGNIVTNNTAIAGGGLFLSYESNAILVNNLVADNWSSSYGSGLYIRGSSPCLLHTTIARNIGSQGSGVYVITYTSASETIHYCTVALTNTILVSQALGINVRAENTATLEATLWGDGAWANGDDYAGDGRIITGTVNVWGDPVFVNPDAGDYHIGLASAAIDKGVDAGVDNDIDGDPRPQGGGYDIGADETGLAVTKQADPDPAQAGAQLTYTIRTTNTSYVDLYATITDTLPACVTTTQSLTWAQAITAAGGVWTEQVVVTVELGCAGPLTNVVQVTTVEGASGVYTNITPLAHTPGVALTPDRTGITNPDSIITYTHTLTNTGNSHDTFDLTHESSRNWTVQYVTPVTLSHNQTTTVLVSITAPSGSSGLTDTTAITTTSQADADVRAAVADTTTVNTSPVADAGPDQFVVPSDAVLLDGSGSTDPDGHLPLTYHWKRTGGPFVILVGADTAQAAFQAPPYQSVLTFTLTVTDTLGLGGSPDHVIVYVGMGPSPNQPPYTPSNPHPSSGATNIPLTQTLSWQGGDPDGDLVTYTVAFGTSDPTPVVAITTLAHYTPTLTMDTTYYWGITASDGISTSVGPTWRFTTFKCIYLPLVLRQ